MWKTKNFAIIDSGASIRMSDVITDFASINWREEALPVTFKKKKRIDGNFLYSIFFGGKYLASIQIRSMEFSR